jgi:very-short-patch-repair endonuclease
VGKERAQLFREDLAKARGLRRPPTEPEKRLWRLLRDRRLADVKFRRQHPVGPYVVDFFCAKAKLVLELDGGDHADVQKTDDDEHRSRELEKVGFRVLRFWNTDVLQNPDGVLKSIAEALLAPSPCPLPGGEGKTP